MDYRSHQCPDSRHVIHLKGEERRFVLIDCIICGLFYVRLTDGWRIYRFGIEMTLPSPVISVALRCYKGVNGKAENFYV
jgi:hypothetical protein